MKYENPSEARAKKQEIRRCHVKGTKIFQKYHLGIIRILLSKCISVPASRFLSLLFRFLPLVSCLSALASCFLLLLNQTNTN